MTLGLAQNVTEIETCDMIETLSVPARSENSIIPSGLWISVTDKGVATMGHADTPTGEPDMITRPTGVMNKKTALKEVKCTVGVGNENGVGIGLIDKGVATFSMDKVDTVAT